MILQVTIKSDEDGIWIAECPSLPGCVSQGVTKEEALENVKEAIAVCLEVRAERGLPLTIETRQVPKKESGAPGGSRPLRRSRAA